MPATTIAAKWQTYHHKDFGEKFCTEQLQHAVKDVLPAIMQYVTVPMCQPKHCPCSQLCLGIVAK